MRGSPVFDARRGTASSDELEVATSRTTVLVATEADLRAAINLDLAIVDFIEGGFRSLGEGSVVMPPIMHTDLSFANAEVDAKAAYVRGLDAFAIKVSPGFFDTPSRGPPSTSGLMVVLDAQTGRVRSVLLDNGYLTNVRTAAAGAGACSAAPEPHGVFSTVSWHPVVRATLAETSAVGSWPAS